MGRRRPPELTPTRVVAVALDVAADRSSRRRRRRRARPRGPHRRRGGRRTGPGSPGSPARYAPPAPSHRGAVVVADSLVAASIVAELDRARVTVDAVGAGDHARACGDVRRPARRRPTLAHRSQAVLDDAVAGAARRPLGDAWLWSRARSSVDISPLVAVTLAAWAPSDRVAATGTGRHRRRPPTTGSRRRTVHA